MLVVVGQPVINIYKMRLFCTCWHTYTKSARKMSFGWPRNRHRHNDPNDDVTFGFSLSLSETANFRRVTTTDYMAIYGHTKRKTITMTNT